ncbi:substrate-binding periplasmic protein [Rhodoferax mekongensis]|uniref:Transporter substrate-binding domain-containing protein n=1 Tax=Rhodoferax mekongensis TaxID=3068341 RepID=A0ABZ0AZC3_9BURK|nr:transporter substrate-binding domain-containing protein [Rhodoferax sp. TBRC 17307]WNO05002.1 transporter substrate-binding domain-containing protein [Rhodoferax sp. TBRC 17307]
MTSMGRSGFQLQAFRTKMGAALLALACACAPAAAQVLRLATGELPPYATQERPDQGIALDIVRRAFALEGLEVEYTFKPWTRTLEESRAGLWDATAYWGRNPERDKGFLISDNVLTEQWVLVYRQAAFKDAPFDWKVLSDLKDLRIGVVQSYTYTPEFWAMHKAGTLKTVVAPDDIANLRLLIGGRLDLVPMERNVACYLMQHHFMDSEVQDLRAHPRLFAPNFTTHVMFSDKLPDSAARLQAFNRGLRALKRTAVYAEKLNWPGCRLNAMAQGPERTAPKLRR